MTAKILIVIESYLNFQNLKLLENQLKIKFNNIFMPCLIINSSIISSIIPNFLGKYNTIKPEIFLDNECISESANNLVLRVVKNEPQITNISPNKSIDHTKKEIFVISNSEIKNRVKTFLIDLKCKIIFFKNGKTSLKNKKDLEDFNETDLKNELEEILIQLVEVENLKLIYNFDKNGYNIIHYICALGILLIKSQITQHALRFYLKIILTCVIKAKIA
jgi:hypothetical protein